MELHPRRGLADRMVAKGNWCRGSRPIKAGYAVTGNKVSCGADAGVVGATVDATGVLGGSFFPQEGDLPGQTVR